MKYPTAATNGGPAVCNRYLAAMPSEQYRLGSQFDQPLLPQLRELRTCNSLSSLPMNNAEHLVERMCKGFLHRPACKHLCGTIEKGDGMFGICGNDRITDARQRDLKPIPLQNQSLFGPLTRGDVAQSRAPSQRLPSHLRLVEAFKSDREPCPVLTLHREFASLRH